MKRDDVAGTSARADAVAALLAEIDQRVAAQVALLRSGGLDPGIKQLVVTDAEADALLEGGEAAVGTLLEPGSLAQCAAGWREVQTLAQRFALAPFELDALLLALAPDLDRRFERLVAYLQDDIARPRPGVELLLKLLAPRHLHLELQAALLPDAPLRRLGLLVADEALRGPGSEGLRVADGVLRFLLARRGPDALVQRFSAEHDASPLARRLWARREEAAAIQAWLDKPEADGGARLLQVHGRAGSGRRHAVEQACAMLNRERFALDLARLKRHPALLEVVLNSALRDAHLGTAGLLLVHADVLFDGSDSAAEAQALLQAWLRRCGGTLLLLTEQQWPLAPLFPAAEVQSIELAPLTLAQREAAWTQALTELDAAPPGTGVADHAALAAALASKFRTHHGEIALALRQCLQTRPAATDSGSWHAALHRAAAAVAAPRLQLLAERIEPMHTLADLVLTADKHEVIADLVRRVKHRRRVQQDWQFDTASARGHGLVALFHGPSGTGKTMAADAIAGTLGMQLFRIDLAGVVSKYIGETEKNLRAIFDEADRADAVLLFDEADALFGKRSEVKDAHDRYANIEINYLLQRIESFEGIAILATNKRSHLDEAFQRRIHVTLEFTLPREAERERLWRRSFPAAAPLAEAATAINWGFVAERFELSGGLIRNAAVGAAYLAADAGAPIGQRELLLALRTELTKIGRRMPESEFAPYQALLASPPPAKLTAHAAAGPTSGAHHG